MSEVGQFRRANSKLDMSVDFKAQLFKQLGFLWRSCDAYHQGHTDEAVRIAAVIRVMIHDTPKSTSLLKHLGALNISLSSTVSSFDRTNADCSQFRHPLQSYAATAATLCRRCKRIVRAEGVVFKSTLAQTPGSSFSRAHRPASQSRAASGPTGSTEPIFFSSIVIVLYSSDMDNREWLEKIPLKMLIVVPATCAILNACFLMFARSGHGMQMSDTAAGSVSGVLLGIALLCVIVGAMRKSLAS